MTVIVGCAICWLSPFVCCLLHDLWCVLAVFVVVDLFVVYCCVLQVRSGWFVICCLYAVCVFFVYCLLFCCVLVAVCCLLFAVCWLCVC